MSTIKDAFGWIGTLIEYCLFLIFTTAIVVFIIGVVIMFIGALLTGRIGT